MAKIHRIDKQTIKKRILPTLLISALLPLIICISIPFDLFANNYNEFYFSFTDFFPYCILFFFIFLAIGFLILLFLPNKLYRVFSGIAIMLALLLFVQSNFLNGKFTALNGDNMAIEEVSLTKKIINICIWAILITGGGIIIPLLSDKKGIISIIAVVISIALFATHIITPVSQAFTKKELFISKFERIKQDDKNAEHKILTSKNFNKVYSESNIYYFVLDRFDEYFAEKALKENPTIFDKLTGFTWFQDNIALYGHTYPAIANMLTQKDYNPESYRIDYLNSVYQGENPLTQLHDNGYEINVYTTDFHGYTDAYFMPECVANRESVKSFKISSHILLTLNFILMGLYRCAPFFIKDLCSFSTSTLNSYVSESTGDETLYTTYNYYIERLEKKDIELSEGKGFHFIHTDGYHDIWSYDDGSGIKNCTEFSLGMIYRFTDYLKEHDLYEESTIIITGDHGKPIDDTAELKKESLTALFVKPAGTNNEPIKISKAQTSHKNIWASIMNSAHIETETDYGKSVFEIPENEDQTRFYWWHTYYNPFISFEYKIVGSGEDFKNWKLEKTLNLGNRSLID